MLNNWLFVDPILSFINPIPTPIDFILNAARFLPEIEITNMNPTLREDGSLSIEFDFRLRN